MPIYEYQCESCGHQFEKLQKISDERLTDCPDCSKPELKKMISAAGFRLKGAGWYETDFKTSNKKNIHGDSKSSSGSDAPSSSKDSGKKTETKSQSAKPGQ